jgi:hypothetical protein
MTFTIKEQMVGINKYTGNNNPFNNSPIVTLKKLMQSETNAAVNKFLTLTYDKNLGIYAINNVIKIKDTTNSNIFTFLSEHKHFY